MSHPVDPPSPLERYVIVERPPIHQGISNFLWRSIRLLRIYSVNCVFLHYGGRYARFTTFRVRIFICGPIGRKWMSNYLKNRSLDLIQTFYDHCTRERGPLKKFLETYNMCRLGDFWGRRKKLKGEYLVEGHSYRSDTSRFTSHESSTPSVFFSNFYSHCLRSNDGVNFGENPIWGNFHSSTRSPLLLFSSLNDEICLKWSGVSVSGSWNPQFWKNSLGEMSLPQLQFTPFFEIFKLIFQFFFKLNTFEMNGADVVVKPHFRKLHRGGH